jgi:hypothetical protein
MTSAATFEFRFVTEHSHQEQERTSAALACSGSPEQGRGSPGLVGADSPQILAMP